LSHEVSTDENSISVLVSGRCIQLQIEKKTPQLWDQLAPFKMTNVVYNMEKMAECEENNDQKAGQIKWVQNRGATMIKDCVPDWGYPDDDKSESDATDSDAASEGRISDDLLQSGDD